MKNFSQDSLEDFLKISLKKPQYVFFPGGIMGEIIKEFQEMPMDIFLKKLVFSKEVLKISWRWLWMNIWTIFWSHSCQKFCRDLRFYSSSNSCRFFWQIKINTARFYSRIPGEVNFGCCFLRTALDIPGGISDEFSSKIRGKSLLKFSEGVTHTKWISFWI